MAHVYDAQSMVDLPRLDAATASTMGTRLGTLAQAEKKLAPNVASAARLLAATVTALVGALKALAPSGEVPVTDVSPERLEASHWSALESVLAAFQRVPPSPALAAKVAAAARVHAALFPEGLRFLRLPADRRWAETERRLGQLALPSIAADLSLVGAADLVPALRAAHVATGVAQGITAPKVIVPEPPQLAGPLDDLRKALRVYVLQLAANAALDETGAAGKLAAALLAPLTDYEPPAPHKAKPAPPPPPPEQAPKTPPEAGANPAPQPPPSTPPPGTAPGAPPPTPGNKPQP